MYKLIYIAPRFYQLLQRATAEVLLAITPSNSQRNSISNLLSTANINFISHFLRMEIFEINMSKQVRCNMSKQSHTRDSKKKCSRSSTISTTTTANESNLPSLELSNLSSLSCHSSLSSRRATKTNNMMYHLVGLQGGYLIILAKRICVVASFGDFGANIHSCTRK